MEKPGEKTPQLSLALNGKFMKTTNAVLDMLETPCIPVTGTPSISLVFFFIYNR